MYARVGVDASVHIDRVCSAAAWISDTATRRESIFPSLQYAANALWRTGAVWYCASENAVVAE